MANHRYQHNLSTFNTLKMEPDKDHICHCSLFYFHQKKCATDWSAHKIICETYSENVTVIRMHTNLLEWFKNVILISMTKNILHAQ